MKFIKYLLFAYVIVCVNSNIYAKDLVIGIGGDIETFDVCCANFIQSHHALYAVYEPPVIYPTVKTSSGALVGDATDLDGTVFESWKAHSDG